MAVAASFIDAAIFKCSADGAFGTRMGETVVVSFEAMDTIFSHGSLFGISTITVWAPGTRPVETEPFLPAVPRGDWSAYTVDPAGRPSTTSVPTRTTVSPGPGRNPISYPAMSIIRNTATRMRIQ